MSWENIKQHYFEFCIPLNQITDVTKLDTKHYLQQNKTGKNG